jgi:hypothetical protein
MNEIMKKSHPKSFFGLVEDVAVDSSSTTYGNFLKKGNYPAIIVLQLNKSHAEIVFKKDYTND